MPRRQNADAAHDLPPLPGGEVERRDQQVKIRLTPSEVKVLQKLRPDLAPSGIVSQIVDDVLNGRYRPDWAAPVKPS